MADVVLPRQRPPVFVRRSFAAHHVTADGVPPLPRLAVGGGHAHHWVVGGVSVDGDDAPASGDAPGVTARAAVSVGGDPVVGRLGAVRPGPGGRAAL